MKDSLYHQAEGRFDWEGYVQQAGGVSAVRGARREYLLGCAQCGREKLAVNTNKRAWRCFTCGTAGRDAASLVVQAEGVLWHIAVQRVLSGGHSQAIGDIAQITAALMPSAGGRPPSWIPKAREVPEGWHPITIPSAPAARGFGYCIERGILADVAVQMGLGVCAWGRFANRLMFPVYDHANRLIFYQGRAMWKPGPDEDRHIKTLSPKLDDAGEYAGAGDVLLNLGTVIRGCYERVLVVEGPIDTAHAWPDAVGTFGKQLSARQVELLLRAGVRELDLCYDNDPPRRAPNGRLIPGGYESMEKMAPSLMGLFKVRLVQLPQGSDPGDLPKQHIEHCRAQALEWGSGQRLNHVGFELR